MHINRTEYKELLKKYYLCDAEVCREAQHMNQSHFTRLVNNVVGLTPKAKLRIEMGLMQLDVDEQDIQKIWGE